MKKFPGFKACLKMMRSKDPQEQDNGFFILESHAVEYLAELHEAFHAEEDHGLRCWLLELIAHTKHPDNFAFLVSHAQSEDERLQYWAIAGLKELNTKECRTLLWKMGHAPK